MKRALKMVTITTLYYLDDNGNAINGQNPCMTGNCTGLTGNCTDLTGDCSGLRGYCTGLTGYCTGLTGDIDKCSISAIERDAGVKINDLIG